MKENIGILLRYVDHILVWENMPKTDAVRYKVVDSPKIEYVGCGDNVGISRALNFAWEYANDNDYDGILTMDQDSIWDNLGQFLSKIEGVYVPEIYNGQKIKKRIVKTILFEFGREDEIRTHGSLRIGDFQDHCNKPDSATSRMVRKD